MNKDHGSYVERPHSPALLASDTGSEIVGAVLATMPNGLLAYCDYIADCIRVALLERKHRGLGIIAEVGKVRWDLHPTEGWFVSTKKTLSVTDAGGKKYRVTVEECE